MKHRSVMSDSEKLSHARVLGLPDLNKRRLNNESASDILRAAYAHAGDRAGDLIRKHAYGQFINPNRLANMVSQWRRRKV